MDGYEAVSSRGELVVSVGVDGVPLGVRLSPAVMDLPAEELASRIVRLNTLARLHCQLAVDQGVRRGGTRVPFGQQRKSRHMRGPSISEGLELWTMRQDSGRAGRGSHRMHSGGGGRASAAITRYGSPGVERRR